MRLLLFAAVLFLAQGASARGLRFVGNQQTGLTIPRKKVLPPPPAAQAQANHAGLGKFNPYTSPNARIRGKH